MKRLCCLLVGLLVVGAFGAAQAQQGTEPITVTDLLKIQQLGSVTASPDGRFVAYVARSIVEKPDADGEYTYRSQLWIIPVHTSDTPRQLTFDQRGASQPAWHPDGDRLAFVRPEDGKPQLFEISVYGGEAQQLTHFEHGATAPRWAPNGNRLLFTTTLSQEDLAAMMNGTPPAWSAERPARTRGDLGRAEANPDGSLAEIRAWLNKNNEEANPRVFTRLDLQGERNLTPQPEFRHYFVLDVEEPGAEPKMITRGYYSFSGGTWLNDSRQLLFSGYPEEAGHPDRERDRDIFLVDADEDRMQRLLDIDGYSLYGPQISPDGNLISFLARDLDDPGYAQTELGLFALDGRTPPEMLTLSFDRSLSNPRWSNDNWFIYFTAASEGGVPLFRLAVNEGKPARPTPTPEERALADSLAADSLAADSLAVLARDSFRRGEIIQRGLHVERLTSTEQGIRSYDITAATAYYVLTEILNPYELYTSTMEFRQQQRLSNHNASWLRTKRLSVPAAFTLRRDTLRIPYWVMNPTFQQRGRTYPMLLEIHGGPSSMWGPGEATMWHEFQFMAAQGYGIVYSNPRGSGGYGHAYKKANYQDWGDGPASDVLAVATETARRQRWVDPDRQVVTGGSYAGYLTAWIVGHDHRFKAAVAQRGVYDLTTFFGEGRAWRLVPNHFGGYPWEAGQLLDYNSPQSYVDQIQTPLLIMHGDNDLRTGVIQSEVLYKSLKALERPVEYVRYPNAGHELSRSGDPKQRIDRLLRIYEFMERYVGDAARLSMDEND